MDVKDAALIVSNGREYRPNPACPRCDSKDLALCPIDSDEGLVIAECSCGWESAPFQIYEEPLHAKVIFDDILDAEEIG